jgi:hypothetical protein
MTAPVIVTIYDAKMKVKKIGLIDYERLDLVIGQIREPCEKNQWTIRTQVPSSESMFIESIKEGF